MYNALFDEHDRAISFTLISEDRIDEPPYISPRLELLQFPRRPQFISVPLYLPYWKFLARSPQYFLDPGKITSSLDMRGRMGIPSRSQMPPVSKSRRIEMISARGPAPGTAPRRNLIFHSGSCGLIRRRKERREYKLFAKSRRSVQLPGMFSFRDEIFSATAIGVDYPLFEHFPRPLEN